MFFNLRTLFNSFLKVDRDQFLKVILLSIVFFFLVGSYTILKELKDVIFLNIIGSDRRYLAYSKLLSMFILLPIIFIHSKLVDVFRRYQILCLYTILYGILSILSGFLIGNENIGLYNLKASPYRLFGWFFYFFIDCYSPLIISMYWAFVNSITKPENVANNYTFLIAGSKLGGILIGFIAYIILKLHYFNDVIKNQILLFLSGILLIFVPIIIYYLIKYIPSSQLHGYEAAYKVDKERKENVQESLLSSIFSGLVLLFQYPYVMGIFSMTFFFELINQVIKVEGYIFVKQTSKTISEFTSFLIWQALLVHILGLIVVIFGTRSLIKMLGEKKSLILIPISTGISVLSFILYRNYFTALIAFVITRAVNYAFAVFIYQQLKKLNLNLNHGLMV